MCVGLRAPSGSVGARAANSALPEGEQCYLECPKNTGHSEREPGAHPNFSWSRVPCMLRYWSWRWWLYPLYHTSQLCTPRQGPDLSSGSCGWPLTQRDTVSMGIGAVSGGHLAAFEGTKDGSAGLSLGPEWMPCTQVVAGPPWGSTMA